MLVKLQKRHLRAFQRQRGFIHSRADGVNTLFASNRLRTVTFNKNLSPSVCATFGPLRAIGAVFAETTISLMEHARLPRVRKRSGNRLWRAKLTKEAARASARASGEGAPPRTQH